eukprot:scaffold89828_cov50-Phaeocystis_antarctica.AAC.2
MNGPSVQPFRCTPHVDSSASMTRWYLSEKKRLFCQVWGEICFGPRARLAVSRSPASPASPGGCPAMSTLVTLVSLVTAWPRCDVGQPPARTPLEIPRRTSGAKQDYRGPSGAAWFHTASQTWGRFRVVLERHLWKHGSNRRAAAAGEAHHPEAGPVWQQRRGRPLPAGLAAALVLIRQPEPDSAAGTHGDGTATPPGAHLVRGAERGHGRAARVAQPGGRRAGGRRCG